jgi:hypothetical protein
MSHHMLSLSNMNRERGLASQAGTVAADDDCFAGGKEGESTIIEGIAEGRADGGGGEGKIRSGGLDVGVGAMMGVAVPTRFARAAVDGPLRSATSSLTGLSDG